MVLLGLAFLIWMVLPVFILGAAVRRMLSRFASQRPMQFGIPELLLIAPAVIPWSWLAAQFLQGTLPSVLVMIVCGGYQISGAVLAWAVAIETTQQIQRWKPAVAMLLGAYAGLFVGCFGFYLMFGRLTGNFLFT